MEPSVPNTENPVLLELAIKMVPLVNSCMSFSTAPMELNIITNEFCPYENMLINKANGACNFSSMVLLDEKFLVSYVCAFIYPNTHQAGCYMMQVEMQVN